jgi:hypothetical protein
VHENEPTALAIRPFDATSCGHAITPEWIEHRSRSECVWLIDPSVAREFVVQSLSEPIPLRSCERCRADDAATQPNAVLLTDTSRPPVCATRRYAPSPQLTTTREL